MNKTTQSVFICVILMFGFAISGMAQRNRDSLDILADHAFVFNINNTPINICFIKNSDSLFVGFIVAGHAEKAVCQIASMEIKSDLEKIGYTDSTIFSFCVAYDLRNKNPGKPYDSLLRKMKQKFIKLKKDNPLQIRILEVSEKEYLQRLEKMHNNFIALKSRLNNPSSKYDRLILNYKNVPFPLVVPFYSTDTIVTFRIKKDIIGDLPQESYRKSFGNEITQSVAEMDKYIRTNQREMTRIQNANDNTREYVFKFYTMYKGNIRLVEQGIGGYSKPPEGFVIIEKDRATGRIVNTRPISFYEAITALNDRTIGRDASDEILLRKWVDDIRKYQNEFNQNKRKLINNIRETNNRMNAEKNILNSYARQLVQENATDNYRLLIDGFLRGWTFNTYNDLMNKQLDDWYNIKRKQTWKMILKDTNFISNSKVAITGDTDSENMAGIFDSENVFFRVKPEGDYYVITPYQVLGGNFFQVIRKKSPYAQFYTLNNFRNSRN
jgi:hypothetical protein